MAREINRLTALQVGKLGTGLHADGGGLYLNVNGQGARSWIYRFMLNGRAREMGLGPLHTVGLAEARRRAGECRLQRLDGIDPIVARTAIKQQAAVAAAKTITFKECARRYITANAVEWTNPKHAAQWTRTLESYAYPHFGDLPVAAIDTGIVLKALQPIWTGVPETANRLRGRIKMILDWARASGYRDGENPARWDGHLDQVLPRPSSAKRAKRRRQGKDEHQPAMPYAEIGGFMAALAGRDALSARALEFTILTAMRTETVLGGRAREIDFAHALWTIPADRPGLKRQDGKPFRVPLSPAALAALRAAGVDPHGAPDRPLFPGAAPGRPLTNILKYLQQDLGRPDCTVHGFRSTFRDWGGDCTNFERDLLELALGHTLGDKVEAAYRRADGFMKRRRLMDAWAKYCAAAAQDKAAGQVVTLQQRRA